MPTRLPALLPTLPSFVRLVGAPLAGLALASSAWATTDGGNPTPAPAHDIQLSYQVDLPSPLPSAITNIIVFNHYQFSGGATWAFQVDAGVNQQVLTDPFLKRSDDHPTEALLLGLVQDLPGDAPGQKHVVMMLSDSAASFAQNIAWGTLFRNTLEADVVDAIQLATSGQPFEVIDPAFTVLDAFIHGDATNGILDALAQPQTAWFGIPMTQAPGEVLSSNFTVMAFSDGQVLGTGIVTATSLLPVPEPGTTALTLAGLLALAARLRRRPAGCPTTGQTAQA